MFQGPAIALFEVDSIARGYVVADAVVKKAPVRLLMTDTVTPGKFLVLIDGEVADVEASFLEGVEVAGSLLLDKLFLPQAHADLSPALRGAVVPGFIDSLAIVEIGSVAATLLAADAALKAAQVRLLKLHLARGIGGKGYFSMTGSLDSIEAAVAAASTIIAPELLVNTEVIASPHADLASRL
ncbi:MAG: BMC domain-containing protein [Myxococcales bacterium]